MYECKCKRCGKKPDELLEYQEIAKELGCTPEEAVRSEEGTYNPSTGAFYCTVCYIKAGVPLGIA